MLRRAFLPSVVRLRVNEFGSVQQYEYVGPLPRRIYRKRRAHSTYPSKFGHRPVHIPYLTSGEGKKDRAAVEKSCIRLEWTYKVNIAMSETNLCWSRAGPDQPTRDEAVLP